MEDKRYQTGGVIKDSLNNVIAMPGETLIPFNVDAQYQAWQEQYMKACRGNGRYHYIGALGIIVYILHNRYATPRLLHLAKYAKKRRVRKKNCNRLARGAF